MRQTMNLIERIDEIPVPDLLRKRTDNCCTVFAILFSLSLFIYSCVVLNTNNAMKVIFPSDSDGNVCGYDYPAYPYVYFGDLQDMSKRICVSHCPALHDARLKCRPTSRAGCFRSPPLSPSSFRMYDTEPSQSRMGFFCVPRDAGTREKLLMRSNLWQRAGFIDSYDTIMICALASVVFGLVYMILVQLLPKIMHYVSIIFGALAPIGLGVWILLHRSHYFEGLKGLRIGLATVLIICGTAMLLCLLMYRRYLRVSAVFLDHSTKFIADRPSSIGYILLFIVFTIGLFIVSAFEFIAVWSFVDPAFAQTRVFFMSRGKVAFVLSIFILIQLYWGLAFLKELFNFCISGNAISWYFGRQRQCLLPFGRVLRFHFGSIVGGSFMVGFFSIGDFIFTLLKPENYMSTYGKCYYPLCGWLTSLFELVRSDAMAYINLTALPYCNASRYCEFLCNNTRLYGGSQSTNRFYRVGAHFFLTALVGLLGLFYNANVSLWAELFIIIAALYTVTFFIDIHADAAEGISVSFLAEEYLEIGDYRQVKRAPRQLINDLLVASGIAQ